MPRSRLVPLAGLLLAVALPLAGPAPARAADGDGLVRTVRISVRVEGDGRDVRLELPLPATDAHQEVVNEKLTPRGFGVEHVERDGNRLAILTYRGLKGGKRVTYEALVRTAPTTVELPPLPIRDSSTAPREDRRWLRPTRHLQSSSPLIRERLIRFATPLLDAGETDAVAICWDLVATGYEHRPGGSRTVLKATRTGHARRIGLDRLLATFLRTSGIPARPVGGLDIRRERGRHLTGWVEAKAGGEWAPLSVPKGLRGELPARYLKLWHGDRPFLVHEGAADVSFRLKVAKLPKEARR